MGPRKVSSWGYSPYGAKAGSTPPSCNQTRLLPQMPSLPSCALPRNTELARARHPWINVPSFKQAGHRSQVELELEESVYALKMVPLFSLAGAANKTSLLLVCCALRVLLLPLFKGVKMLLTLLFKQTLQSSREVQEQGRRKDERQEKFLDPLSLN